MSRKKNKGKAQVQVQVVAKPGKGRKGKNKRKNRSRSGVEGMTNTAHGEAWGLCALYDILPPMKRSGESSQQYLYRLRHLVLGAYVKKLGDLNQICTDPEWPDTFESWMAFVLLPKCKSVHEFVAATQNVANASAAQANGTGGASTGGSTGAPSSTSSGSSSSSAGQQGSLSNTVDTSETWTQNTQDWWDETLSGNWDAGLQSWEEGWNSLISGNF